MRNTKKAFTLVELIVVITILAVLGTIAFISLQGYSAEARDSKRLSNVNDLVKKINIEVSKGTAISTLLSGAVAHSGVINNTADSTANANMVQWSVDFLALKENGDDFKDGTNEYPFAYSVGGSGTGAYKFIQMATLSEALNNAKVVGNYYKMVPANDSESMITNVGTNAAIVDTNAVTDGGTILPYTIN